MSRTLLLVQNLWKFSKSEALTKKIISFLAETPFILLAHTQVKQHKVLQNILLLAKIENVF